MNVYKYPSKADWNEIVKRPTLKNQEIDKLVVGIIEDVKQRGDRALCDYALQFDGVTLNQKDLCVDVEFIKDWDNIIDRKLREAIDVAVNNITTFHTSQKLESKAIETIKGVVCSQKAVAIEKVGLYIPGGTAPLFSTVLMLGIPAKIAGCREVVLCTPPDAKGNVNPIILYAAHVVGIKKVYKVGGAQAIAAMAYGTETIPKVYKIFGPGNQFVTKAKQFVSLNAVAIDMPAGPSEVLVMADEFADADFIAADILSQCEHGKDSQGIFLTTSQKLLHEVQLAIEKQLALLHRADLASVSLDNSGFVLLHSVDEMIEFSNLYAPEHLIIQTENYHDVAGKIVNAGSVFLGKYTPESAGDYASGTNHTLPTNGYCRAYSGVNLDAFVKKITFQEISKQGLENIGTTIETMAEYEQLDAHKYAVTIRLSK